jgi:hypothetical protein
MAKYFNYFPKTYYDVDTDKNNLEVVTNIISRFTFESKIKENAAAFYQYEVKDSDTPEIIATKFYDDPERHWIILAFNDIIDPQWDWPLGYRSFYEYVKNKYQDEANTANEEANATIFLSGYDWAKSANNIHSYYKVITVRNNKDNDVYSNELEVDSNTYIGIASTTNSYTLNNSVIITETVSKKTKTYLEYEEEVNESKRKINLLKPEFVPAVEKEFKRVIK